MTSDLLFLTEKFISPILAIIATYYLNRIIEKKPKLFHFIQHASATKVKVRDNDGKITSEFFINSHSLVVRNSGNLPTKNVVIQIGSNPMPDYSIWPETFHKLQILESGAHELYFDVLRPKDQMTISFMYPNYLTINNIFTSVKSDDGVSELIPITPTPVPEKWKAALIVILLFLGILTATKLALYLYLNYGHYLLTL